MPIPFLKPGQTPDPVSLGGPLYDAMFTALLTQEEWMAEEMRELCHRWDCLVWEAEKAEMEGNKMFIGYVICWTKGQMWEMNYEGWNKT